MPRLHSFLMVGYRYHHACSYLAVLDWLDRDLRAENLRGGVAAVGEGVVVVGSKAVGVGAGGK